MLDYLLALLVAAPFLAVLVAALRFYLTNPDARPRDAADLRRDLEQRRAYEREELRARRIRASLREHDSGRPA